MSKTNKQEKTTEEHPEARMWRMQLCAEQGRRFRLENENKRIRAVLADALKRLADIEFEIDEHRNEGCDNMECCLDRMDL